MHRQMAQNLFSSTLSCAADICIKLVLLVSNIKVKNTGDTTHAHREVLEVAVSWQGIAYGSVQQLHVTDCRMLMSILTW